VPIPIPIRTWKMRLVNKTPHINKLHLLGLQDSPFCRKCGVSEETSAHILCECEALVSLRHAYLGSFFLELEDIRSVGLGAIWNYSKATGAPMIRYGAQRAC